VLGPVVEYCEGGAASTELVAVDLVSQSVVKCECERSDRGVEMKAAIRIRLN
jgi:hypothetical protein